MGPGEKKVVVALTIVLAALIAVLVVWKPQTTVPMANATPGGRMAAAGGGAAGCSTSGAPAGGAGVPTQEFGKKGAKLEILAMLPITHRCHVNTEAELKKAYQMHPSDIHLIIMDLFGPDGQAAVRKYGGSRALVVINEKSAFTLNGRPVVLEKAEGTSYQVSDIIPIIEQELKTKT